MPFKKLTEKRYSLGFVNIFNNKKLEKQPEEGSSSSVPAEDEAVPRKLQIGNFLAPEDLEDQKKDGKDAQSLQAQGKRNSILKKKETDGTSCPGLSKPGEERRRVSK